MKYGSYHTKIRRLHDLIDKAGTARDTNLNRREVAELEDLMDWYETNPYTLKQTRRQDDEIRFK